MLFKLLQYIFASLLIAFCPYALASGHGGSSEPEPEQLEPEIGYYPLTPDLTTNVATLNPRDKLHYVRIKMSLMIEDSRDSTIIADVEPVIRDAIITILGTKEFGQVATNEAREKIRIECREKIISIMREKFGKPIIMDLLFLNYMYQ
ncbi:MAG: flagellar basal body-associated FliL family protein [Succinivibrio sp.]